MSFKKITIEQLPFEKKILSLLIIDQEFCLSAFDFLKKEYFEQDFEQVIFQWTKEYYLKYKNPIKEKIQDIFSIEKEKMSEEKISIVGNYLLNLSDFSINEKNSENSSFYIDKTREWAKNQGLKKIYTKGKKLVDLGRYDKAEKLLLERPKVEFETGGFIDFFDGSEVDKFFLQQIEKEDGLFLFDGKLGEYLGAFERKELVTFTAPEKGKKSFMLQAAVIAALEANRKVLWYSNEMDEYQIKERFYPRMTGTMLDKHYQDNNGLFIVPVFDCDLNQSGDCLKSIRKNKEILLDKKGRKPSFRLDMKYKPCTLCRGNYAFKTSYWFKKLKNPKILNKKILNKKLKNFQKNWKGKLVFKKYSNFTITFDQIYKDLEILEKQNFVPDVIVDDYLGIHGWEPEATNERSNIDITWKKAKRLADEYDLCYITGDQAKADAQNRMHLKETDWDGSKSITAHLNRKIGLNQGRQESEDGVVRISNLFNRSGKGKKNYQVMVLMALDSAYVNIDSEYISRDLKTFEE